MTLACDLARLCHVHGWAGVGACIGEARARGRCVRACLRDMGTTAVVELGVWRARRRVLSLRLRTLLLLLSWLLQAHLLHLSLTHQLGIVVLVVGCIARGIHVGILLGRCLLLSLLLRLLLGDLLRLILVALVGVPGITVGPVRNSAVGLVRCLIVIIRRCIPIRILLLRSADASSGIHCILAHLARRLRLVFQLFRGKVGKLSFRHLRIACSQLILDLYDRRHMAR